MKSPLDGNYKFVSTWIVFIAAAVAFVYKFTREQPVRRNYETSLISADPLCFDLRTVMAAIISCEFERRIITIHAPLRNRRKFCTIPLRA